MTDQSTDTVAAFNAGFNAGIEASIALLMKELNGVSPADSHEAFLAAQRLGHYRHHLRQLLKRTEAERQAEAEAATRRAT